MNSDAQDFKIKQKAHKKNREAFAAFSELHHRTASKLSMSFSTSASVV
ncbi:hypothetical protein shim_07530 [Shimia sp. SK013]|nr:hypothetical protein shim_07530 [Shimia sp. SK013]